MPTCPSKSSRIRTQLIPCKQQPRVGGRWLPTVAPGPVEDSIRKACPVLRHLVSTCRVDTAPQGGPLPVLHNRQFTSKLQLLLPGPPAQVRNCRGRGRFESCLLCPSWGPLGFAPEAPLLSSLHLLLRESSRGSPGASCLTSTLCRAAGVLFQNTDKVTLTLFNTPP